MMSANLVGFAIGIDGMKYMIQQLFGSWQGMIDCLTPLLSSHGMVVGIQFLFLACMCLFAGVQVMFEYR
jgi:membrane-bound O-acyltransferase GUP1_2